MQQVWTTNIANVLESIEQLCLFMLNLVTVFEMPHTAQTSVCMSDAQSEFRLLPLFVA